MGSGGSVRAIYFILVPFLRSIEYSNTIFFYQFRRMANIEADNKRALNLFVASNICFYIKQFFLCEPSEVMWE